MLISTKGSHSYLLNEDKPSIMWVHPIIQHLYEPKNKKIDLTSDDVKYYHQKFRLLKRENFFQEKDKTEFTGRLSVDLLKSGICSNRNLLFEVTTRCNLLCKYCIYGDLYNQCKKRVHQNLSTHLSLPYLIQLIQQD